MALKKPPAEGCWVKKRKRAAGIEPASSAWKAEVLPLNYARTSTNVRPEELAAGMVIAPIRSSPDRTSGA